MLVGVVIACFVAFNVGGATTGPSFGPAVGAQVIGKAAAGVLMSVFFFLGAWTVGRRVVETLGRDLVQDSSVFTVETSIVVLFFIGGALLVGNLSGVPASTSMTAVGAIVGLAFAAGELEFTVVSEILAWWILSPVIGFWLSLMIGRYYYAKIDRIIAIEQSDGPLLTVDTDGIVPRPSRGPNTSRRELIGSVTVVGVGCLLAFSSGTSNIATAIAPLVGSGALGMNVGILLGSAAVTVGALTIARRTVETLGNDITDLPLTAAIVVSVLSSSLVVLLSALGIPASFVIIVTVCIVGLGWGRSTRAVTLADAARGNATQRPTVDALANRDTPTVGDPQLDGRSPSSEQSRTEQSSERPSRSELFDPAATVGVIVMQNVVPIIATVGSYATFALLDIV